MDSSKAEQEFARAISNHVDQLHNYDPEQIAQWISEHEDLVINMKPVVIDTHRLVKGIITEMHGEEVVTAIGTEYTGGFVEEISTIHDRQARVLDQLQNGGVRVKLSRGAWLAISAIIVQLGLITVAIIQRL